LCRLPGPWSSINFFFAFTGVGRALLGSFEAKLDRCLDREIEKKFERKRLQKMS
jgi:hypothetical protein